MNSLRNLIEKHYAEQQKHPVAPPEVLDALAQVISGLDQGKLRVAESIDGVWVTHAWIKQAVLLAFKYYKNQSFDAGITQYYDKIPLKYSNMTDEEFADMKIRLVPNATVRSGVFIAQNTVLMPCFVNTGAYIDTGTMIDTWATVGSCAQIGKNVHISGGVGIGGVLEPLQANPTIIEDNCFIGARSEVVEGVIVERGSVLSMGVFIGQSTKIYNRMTGEISYGRVPAGSVVVPGTLPAADLSHSLACAVIIKQVDEKTRSKTSINELLRP